MSTPTRDPTRRRPLSGEGRAGFTLVELLVVLALAAIMLTMGWSRLSSSTDVHRARKAADEFLSFREYARSTAIRLGRTVEMRVDYSTDRFWVEVGSDTVVDPRGLSIDRVDMLGSSDPVCFDARGIPTSVGGCDPVTDTIVFMRGNAADSLLVQSGGHVENR